MRIAVLGCGNVGAALVGILQDRADALAVQSGARLELAGIAVNDLSRRPGAPHPGRTARRRTPVGLVARPVVDVVVELIGGLEPAGALVRAALESGKPVVTANKALLASREGVALRTLGRCSRASTCSTRPPWPVPSRWSGPCGSRSPGERIHRVMGIVNGTTNFILTKMERAGRRLRRRAGGGPGASAWPSATPRPTSRATTPRPRRPSWPRGLRVRRGRCRRASRGDHGQSAPSTSPSPNASATRSSCWPSSSGSTGTPRSSVRVHPAHGAQSHPLAGGPGRLQRRVHRGRGGRRADALRPGRGGLPDGQRRARRPDRRGRATCSAGTTAPAPERRPARLLPESTTSGLSLLPQLDVADRPGVLAAVARVFGDHDVSIRSMEQVGLRRRGPADLPHPRGPGGRRAGHPRRAAPARTRWTRIGGVLRIVGDAE